MLDNAYYSDADHIVAVSATHNKKKNPLDIKTKYKYLKLLFPYINFQQATKDCPTFMHFLVALNKKYDELVMITGEDRINEYTRLIEKYNGVEFNYSHISVISAGNRKDCDVGVCGSSSTKMRQFALDGDLESFIANCPTDNREYATALYGEVRHGMGLKTEEFALYK